jgi:hypothetical protein
LKHVRKVTNGTVDLGITPVYSAEEEEGMMIAQANFKWMPLEKLLLKTNCTSEVISY